MTYETKLILRSALENAMGDNLERAEIEFRGQDLTALHGNSGRTKGAILVEYRKDRAAKRAAMAELEAL